MQIYGWQKININHSSVYRLKFCIDAGDIEIICLIDFGVEMNADSIIKYFDEEPKSCRTLVNPRACEDC